MHAAVCDFIVDCLQNSVEAGADRVDLELAETEKLWYVCIRDNGRGMSREVQERVKDPFYTDGVKHQHRKVGLGIPFLVQAVEAVDGEFTLKSREGEGTSLSFTFLRDHVDTPPLGDFAQAVLQGMLFDGSYELTVQRSMESQGKRQAYRISKSELEEILGELQKTEAMLLARQYLRSQEEEMEKEMGNGKNDP